MNRWDSSFELKAENKHTSVQLASVVFFNKQYQQFNNQAREDRWNKYTVLQANQA